MPILPEINSPQPEATPLPVNGLPAGNSSFLATLPTTYRERFVSWGRGASSRYARDRARSRAR